MDDCPKFMQIELRSGLVLLPLTYTPSRVARDGGKKKRGKAAGAGTSRPQSALAPVKAESVGSSIYPGVNAVEGVADAAQGGLGFPEVPPGFEKVKAAPAPATPAPVASPSTTSAKKVWISLESHLKFVWAGAGEGARVAVTRCRRPALELEDGLHVAEEPAASPKLGVAFLPVEPGVSVVALTAGGAEDEDGSGWVQNGGNGGGGYGNAGRGGNDAGWLSD
uniref:Uncharacterized protein n=1 Tax=Oryza glumipatula TaxID=40148 RepID=A0A0D9Y773_9ORYZ